jgi:chromosome segregation ATPase
MAPFFARHGAGEILARYSFIEPLLSGRRVLELGAAEVTVGASALLLAERGAAAVLSLVERGPAMEAARAAGHHPFVRFDDATLESLPEGAFDLILLADGASLADDPGRIVSLRRLLAEKGHLVTAIPAAGGRSLAELAGDATPVQSPAYETFIGALTEHFPWVEVATQSASVGYIIAVPPPEGEEAEVSIDGSQAGDADAAAYVALCGEEPTGLAGITMVALPARLLLDAAAVAREAAVADAAQAGGATATLEARVAELTAASEAAAVELARLKQERAALAAERDTLMAVRQLAAEEREALLQDREAAMAGEAEARAAMESLLRGGQESEQALEKLRSVEALCDAEREAGAAARADAERLGGLLGLRDRELSELREQQESFRQRLAEAEMEASRLGEERTRAVTELAERASVGVETEAGLRAARAEAQAARSVLEGTLARADAAEARVQELEDGLDRRVSELSALRAELEAGRTRVAGATELEATLRSRVEAAEAALLTARGELDRLREEAVTARGEAETALREIDEAHGEAARATAVLAELRAELQATGEALEETRGQLEAARSVPPAAPAAAPSPELEARVVELTTEAARLGVEASRLASERDGLAAQLDEAHRQADREREQLVGQLDEARAIIKGAADRLREMEAQRASAEADAQLQRERAAEAVARARDAEAQLAGSAGGPAAEELEAAKATATRAEAALAGARRDVEAAEGQAAGIEAELQAVRWEKEELEQRLAALQELERRAAADRSDAVSAVMEASRLRGDIEGMRAELEPLRAELARLRGGGEARDLEVEGIRAELARVQGELADRATATVPATASAGAEPGGNALGAAEKEHLMAVLAERDLKIGRLQREVTDKTDRLGRLAAELGELKAKGLSKIFR